MKKRPSTIYVWEKTKALLDDAMKTDMLSMYKEYDARHIVIEAGLKALREIKAKVKAVMNKEGGNE